MVSVAEVSEARGGLGPKASTAGLILPAVGGSGLVVDAVPGKDRRKNHLECCSVSRSPVMK